MSLPIIALFIAAFAFGTTEFVIAGVLPNVAEGLSVTIPMAGYLVTGYAAGMAVGGPIMTILTGRLRRKTLLIGLLTAFTIGQAACALAPDFASMLVLRIVLSVAHGVYFGVAMVVAVSLVTEEKRGMAVAFVLAGLTVSSVLGVPAGAAIGNEFGWRATFWAMFGLGLFALIAILVLIPRRIGAPRPDGGLLDEIRVLKRQQVWMSILLMLMLMIGQFGPYTYIVPLLDEVTGLSESMIPIALLLYGIGTTAGVFLGGRLATWKLMPTVITLFAAQAAIMVVMVLFVRESLPMLILIPIWGCVNFSIGTPLQTRILGWTQDAPNLAASLIPAGFNLGIAIAATLGSIILTANYGYADLLVLGVIAMLMGGLLAIASMIWETRSGATPPKAAPAQ